MAVKPAGIDTEQNYVTVTLCIVTDVPRFVCLSVGQSVSLLDTLVNPAEAAGQIEMPIGMSTRLDPRIHSMDWMGFRSSTRKEFLGDDVGISLHVIGVSTRNSRVSRLIFLRPVQCATCWRTVYSAEGAEK